MLFYNRYNENQDVCCYLETLENMRYIYDTKKNIILLRTLKFIWVYIYKGALVLMKGKKLLENLYIWLENITVWRASLITPKDSTMYIILLWCLELGHVNENNMKYIHMGILPESKLIWDEEGKSELRISIKLDNDKISQFYIIEGDFHGIIGFHKD